MEKQLHVSARGHLQVVSCGFARKCFPQRPVIYNDRRGGMRSHFTKCGGFFGQLAWRLQALLCGQYSWASPCVFGVHWVLWGFRSVDVLDVVFCSTDKKLHCWCDFTYHPRSY
jgi:hypothetical protein